VDVRKGRDVRKKAALGQEKLLPLSPPLLGLAHCDGNEWKTYFIDMAYYVAPSFVAGNVSREASFSAYGRRQMLDDGKNSLGLTTHSLTRLQACDDDPNRTFRVRRFEQEATLLSLLDSSVKRNSPRCDDIWSAASVCSSSGLRMWCKDCVVVCLELLLSIGSGGGL
jgi:hypothetical protein